jgi:cytochrome c-type biogenesis protein CcmF
MPMTEVAIDRGVTRDLYVSMGEPLENGAAWSVRLYVKPFVNWIWGGCVLMALGGLMAVADRRYRVGSRERSASLPAGAAAR